VLALLKGHAGGQSLGDLAPPAPPFEEPSTSVQTVYTAQDLHAGAIPPFGFRLREVRASSSKVCVPGSQPLVR